MQRCGFVSCGAWHEARRVSCRVCVLRAGKGGGRGRQAAVEGCGVGASPADGVYHYMDGSVLCGSEGSGRVEGLRGREPHS